MKKDELAKPENEAAVIQERAPEEIVFSMNIIRVPNADADNLEKLVKANYELNQTKRRLESEIVALKLQNSIMQKSNEILRKGLNERQS